MSDTNPYPGSNRTSPRQLLTAISRAPRRLVIASTTGLIALASAAALVAASAAAQASTTTPLPGCILPAGVHWQLVSFSPPPGRQLFNWGASANGITYTGHTGVDLNPTAARADGYPAACNETTN